MEIFIVILKNCFFVIKFFTYTSLAALGAFSVLAVFFVFLLMILEKDWLLLMRKSIFKRKLKKEGFQTAQEYIETLFQSTLNDWKFEDNFVDSNRLPPKMIYQRPLVNKVNVVFSYTLKEVRLESLFYCLIKFHYGEGEKENQYYENNTDKNINVNNASVKCNYLYLHLNEIYNQLVEKQNHQKKLNEKDQELLKKLNEEAKQTLLINQQTYLLQCIKQQNFSLFESNPYGFTYEIEQSPAYINLNFLKDNQIIYNLFYNKNQHTFSSTIGQSIFHDFLSEQHLPLEKWLKSALLDVNELQVETKQHELKLLQLFKKTFYNEEKLQQRTELKELMYSLEQNAEWLSPESLHQLNETLPADLEALYDVFSEMENTAFVIEDIDDSLNAIHEKLVCFKDEIQQNKANQIKRRKNIILSR